MTTSPPSAAATAAPPSAALPTAAPQAPSVAPPGPRRLWLCAALRTFVVAATMLGIVTLVCPGLFGAWSTRANDALPSSIDLAWPWQASVREDPPGPAAVLASALDDEEGGAPVEVVGRNGVYRSIYPSTGSWLAGETLHLSPDGRHLALPYLDDPRTASRGPTIIDLTTGESRVVATAGLAAGQALAVLGWRPDGGALLLATTGGGRARVVLLDLRAEAVTRLADLPAALAPTTWRAAFAPDGDRIALDLGGSLQLVDGRGKALWTVPLTGGAQLAGAGAFTPDGARIALVQRVPCPTGCPAAPEWAVTYVDSTDGTDARGPALPTIAGSRVRAAGWTTRDDGTMSLVVVRYLPPPPPQPLQQPDGSLVVDLDAQTASGAAPADLYELAPGKPARLLLDAPYEVTGLDVAAALVRAGRFEGEPSMPSLLPIEPDRLRPTDVVLAATVASALAAVVGVVVNLTGRPWRRLRPLRRWARSSAAGGTYR